MTKQKKRAAALMILAAAFLWGLTGLFTTELADHGITTLTVVSVRAICACLLLILWFLWRDRRVFRIRLRDTKYFLGTGLLSFALFSWCYFQCIQTCSLSVAVVLLYTAPAFVVLMSRVLWKTPLTWQKLLALGLTLVGCVLITGLLEQDTEISLVGIVYGVTSGFCYGLYSIFSRYALKRYSPSTVTMYTFVFAAAALCFVCDWQQVWDCLSQVPLLIPSLCLILLCTVAPYLLYTSGLQKIESGHASILATLEPVVATLLGVLLLGDGFSVWNGVGMVCILCSLWILR